MIEYQFVSWWPDWHGFHFLKPDPKSGYARIYEWYLYLGWWEIRKWKKGFPTKSERRW